MTQERACYVYWIRERGMEDINTEGYVGVSLEPESRFKNHRREALGSYYRKNSDFCNSLIKNECFMEIQGISSESNCYKIERFLRPRANIGWNLAVGGDKPINVADKYYSEFHGIEMTTPEWANFMGIRSNTISCRLSRRYSVDEAIGVVNRRESLKMQRVEADRTDLDKLNALYLLENTLLTESKIAKLSGFNCTLKRLMKDFNLPSWMFSYAEVTMPSGTWALRIKRQKVITDFGDVLKIYDRYFMEGETVNKIAEDLEMGYGTIKHLLEDIDNAKFIT